MQGVGGRPYIFSLARRRALRGHVLNNAMGFLIDVEGETNAVEQFINEIKFGAPPLSQIESVERRDNPALANRLEFRIAGSESAGRKSMPKKRATRGPRLSLTDASGRELETGDDAIGHTRGLLLNGMILAIKGAGGFHLACDATNAEAVERLRRRKYCEDKPFALMAGSIEAIEEYCFVSTAERDLLLSARRPVVLLARKPDSILSNRSNRPNWPNAAAPGLNSLGFMLPCAPSHYLLMENLDRPLVMTSGNVSDEPICYEDRDALERLGAIADYFLLHNRRIHIHADDSVVCAHANREMILRRSRGYAPQALRTSFKFAREILACGADLKSAICLTRDGYAFVSHHIGDLINPETLRSFEHGIGHLKRLFNLRPEVIAHDLSPEYISTKYAMTLSDEFVTVGVQHHHAHIASCMVDNRIDGEVIGVAMDGLGYGADGRLWGGEFFVADFEQAERVAHLEYTPMPGGARAVREPWRMAAIYLYRALGAEVSDWNLDFVKRLDRGAWATLRQMATTGLSSPETSSMGRLFDAVASLTGVRDVARYEGQAAIELEMSADESQEGAYEFEYSGKIIKPSSVICGIVADLVHRVPKPVIAAKFHNAVARLILEVARRIRAERQLRRVALSGGVFQNRLLLNRAVRLLEAAGFEVFTHSRVPPNNGGIALGQAVVADALIKANQVNIWNCSAPLQSFRNLRQNPLA